MSKGMRTEDEVRDSAKLVLGFDKTEDGVQQGTGQITTFNQLGFRGCNDKPDGWYLPDDASKPAIILETKSETEGVSKEKHVKELFKNIDVVAMFVPQQGIMEDIPVTDDDLLLLDDDNEDTEEYDWYNEPPAEDFGNLDID